MVRTTLHPENAIIREVEPGDFESLIEMLTEMSRVLSMQDRIMIKIVFME